MNEKVQLLLRKTGPVFCIDIGGQTQNALLARAGQLCENWPRFTLPSRACMIAQRIRELTLLKLNIWLYGCEMGGSFLPSLKDHLAAGFKAAATLNASKSIHDRAEVVENMGVKLAETCPAGYVPIYCGDYDPAFWATALRHASLPQPHMILSCVQDHGDHSNVNTEARMSQWEALIKANPDPAAWIYGQAPENMSRLQALQSHTGGPVADSATCAILGALCDDKITARSFREGITILHAGNVHTLGALVYKAKVCAIYEHHTDRQDLERLLNDIAQFRLRWLPKEQVRNAGGHGTVYVESGESGESFEPTYIMGPKREIFKNMGKFIAPHGDMLHAGCQGLLYGWTVSHAPN